MEQSACLWDFSRPEAPSVVTIDVGPDAIFHGWSPSGASFFVSREVEGQAPNGARMYMWEERRAADGSLVRAVSLGPGDDFPVVHMSPDAHALLLDYRTGGGPSRVVVFD